jgi:hypothetical protein
VLGGAKGLTPTTRLLKALLQLFDVASDRDTWMGVVDGVQRSPRGGPHGARSHIVVGSPGPGARARVGSADVGRGRWGRDPVWADPGTWTRTDQDHRCTTAALLAAGDVLGLRGPPGSSPEDLLCTLLGPFAAGELAGSGTGLAAPAHTHAHGPGHGPAGSDVDNDSDSPVRRRPSRRRVSLVGGGPGAGAGGGGGAGVASPPRPAPSAGLPPLPDGPGCDPQVGSRAVPGLCLRLLAELAATPVGRAYLCCVTEWGPPEEVEAPVGRVAARVWGVVQCHVTALRASGSSRPVGVSVGVPPVGTGAAPTSEEVLWALVVCQRLRWVWVGCAHGGWRACGGVCGGGGGEQ